MKNSVLAAGAVAAGGVLLAACGGSAAPASAPASSGAPTAGSAPASASGAPAASPASASAPSSPASVSNLKFRLGWLSSGQESGEFYALEKGYFKDEGLNVSITPGGPNIDSVSLVAAGSADIGQSSSSPSVILARSHGVPIKSFATALQRHPFAWFSLKAANITSAKDFAGKRIGIQATARPLIDALMAKNNIDPSQVKIVIIGGDMLPLINKQVDAASAWVIDKAQVDKLPANGYNTLLLWDTGIQLYANPYFVTEQVLAQKSKQIAGFLRAAARGWADAYKNQEDAIAAVKKNAPTIDPKMELETLKAMQPFMYNDFTKQHGWGAMDQSIWQNDIDTYAQLKQIDKTFPATDVITMDILNATPERPKQ